MKAVLVFVILSLLGASLARRDIQKELNECAQRFPVREYEKLGTSQYPLCHLTVIGMYEYGKFDVNGLAEELWNKIPPQALLKIQNIISSNKGQNDSNTAFLILQYMAENDYGIW